MVVSLPSQYSIYKSDVHASSCYLSPPQKKKKSSGVTFQYS